MPSGKTIYESPHRHKVNQMLAMGYSCEAIARILWERYRFKVTGYTVANYKKEYFEPLKEQFEEELKTIKTLKQAAEIDLSQTERLQSLVQQLEGIADFLEPLKDPGSIKLRSDVLFRAGTLRLRLLQLTRDEEIKKREEELLSAVVKLIADYILPYVPEDMLEEVKKTFELKLADYLETGRLKANAPVD